MCREGQRERREYKNALWLTWCVAGETEDALWDRQKTVSARLGDAAWWPTSLMKFYSTGLRLVSAAQWRS